MAVQHRVRPLHGGNGKIPGGPLKKFRMSRKRQAKVLRMNGEPVIDITLAKTTEEWLSRVQFILLQLDRSQLTAVHCNRRVCKDNTSKDPFSRCEICKTLRYRLS